MSDPTFREVTALHEAGHAVIAWHFGRQIDTISIREIEDTAGRVIIHELHCDRQKAPNRFKLLAFYDALILMGGWAAEHSAWPHLYPKPDPDSSDNYHFVSAAMLLWPDVSDNAVLAERCNRLCIRALELVEHYWSAVTAVADTLLRLGELPGVQVDVIIRDAVRS